jgi:uncharacterized protein
MRYEWDERKRRVNLRKHGFDFLDAARVFRGATLTLADDRHEYGEERFITFGLLRDTVVAIAHSEHQKTMRIISRRKATRHEEKSYFAQIDYRWAADSEDEE